MKFSSDFYTKFVDLVSQCHGFATPYSAGVGNPTLSFPSTVSPCFFFRIQIQCSFQGSLDARLIDVALGRFEEVRAAARAQHANGNEMMR